MATDKEWFDSLWEDYETEAGMTAFGKEELKTYNRAAGFSFYEGLNPLWLMSHAERAALILLMTRISPRVVIEIGSRYAGSTYIFSRYAKTVYVIDIDPAIATRCRHLKNVEVLTGESSKLLPLLIERLNDSGEGWDFALVDGDHSSEGVKNDLNAVLEKRPIRCAWIAMHDSFNPVCRKGIKEANWNNPWVHQVEIDFVPGHLISRPNLMNQMWGGISLAEIRPEDRAIGQVELKEDSGLLFKVAYSRSIHRHNRYLVRGMNKLKRMMQPNK